MKFPEIHSQKTPGQLKTLAIKISPSIAEAFS
jgi:hypothetical protein